MDGCHLPPLHVPVSYTHLDVYKRQGYELARPKEEITLYDVMCSIMGEYALSRCVDTGEEECQFTCTNPHNACPASCKTRKVYTEISQLVREKLRAVTFADLT